jgi:hypothetical protein
MVVGATSFAAHLFVVFKNNEFIVQIVPSQNYSQSEKLLRTENFFLISADRYFKSIQSNLKLTLGATEVILRIV